MMDYTSGAGRPRVRHVFGEDLVGRLDQNLCVLRFESEVQIQLSHLVVEVSDLGYEYELTPMGRDLATLMTALQQWGDRWIYGEGHEPLLILDRRSGRRIPRLRILDNEGRPLAGRDMALAPGPGASKRTRARYGAT